jgi:hypothetical protein
LLGFEKVAGPRWEAAKGTVGHLWAHTKNLKEHTKNLVRKKPARADSAVGGILDAFRANNAGNASGVYSGMARAQGAIEPGKSIAKGLVIPAGGVLAAGGAYKALKGKKKQPEQATEKKAGAKWDAVKSTAKNLWGHTVNIKKNVKEIFDGADIKALGKNMKRQSSEINSDIAEGVSRVNSKFKNNPRKYRKAMEYLSAKAQEARVVQARMAGEDGKKMFSQRADKAKSVAKGLIIPAGGVATAYGGKKIYNKIKKDEPIKRTTMDKTAFTLIELMATIPLAVGGAWGASKIYKSLKNRKQDKLKINNGQKGRLKINDKQERINV